MIAKRKPWHQAVAEDVPNALAEVFGSTKGWEIKPIRDPDDKVHWKTHAVHSSGIAVGFYEQPGPGEEAAVYPSVGNTESHRVNANKIIVNEHGKTNAGDFEYDKLAKIAVLVQKLLQARKEKRDRNR